MSVAAGPFWGGRRRVAIAVAAIAAAVGMRSTARAEPPELRVQLGHSQRITAAALSGDGRFGVTGDELGVMFLWNAETGAEIRRFREHTERVRDLFLSRDGGRILSSGGDRVAISWASATGKSVRLTGHTQSVEAGVLSDDGRFAVTGSWDGTARIWDAATGAELAQLPHPGERVGVLAVAISPDGSWIVTGCTDGTVTLWSFSGKRVRLLALAERQHRDVSKVAFVNGGRAAVAIDVEGIARAWALDGRQIWKLGGLEGRADALALMNGGDLLASGDTEQLIVWDWRTGKAIRRLPARPMQSLSTSADGARFLTCCDRGVASELDAATGATLSSSPGDLTVVAAGYSADGKYLVEAGDDGTVRVWAREPRRVARQLSLGGRPVAMALSPVASLAAVALEEGRIVLVGLENGQTVTSWGVGARVFSIAVSPDGKTVLTGHGTCKAVSWNASTGGELRRFEHRDQRQATCTVKAVFSPDASRILTLSEQTARVWDAATGREAARTQLHYFAESGAFSRDGRVALLGDGDGSIQVWDWASRGSPGAASGREIGQLGFGGYQPLAVLDDGRTLLSGNARGSLRLWDTASGAAIRSVGQLGAGVGNLATSRDGRRAVATTGTEAFVVDLAGGGEMTRLSGVGSSVRAVAELPDRRILSVAEDGTAHLWDLQSGRLVQRGQALKGPVTAVAIAPQGGLMIAGGQDGNAQLLRLPEMKVLQTFSGHAYGVTAVDVSPDGTRVLTADGDRTFRLWDARAGRELRRFGNFGVPDENGVLPMIPSTRIDGLETYQVLLARGGATAFTASSDWSAFWSTSSSEKRYHVTDSYYSSAALSPAGDHVLLGTEDGRALLLRADTAAVVFESRAHGTPLTAVTFTPDGRLAIAAAQDGVVIGWEVAGGKETLRFRADVARAISVTRDGRHLLTAGVEGATGLWTLATGQPVARLIAMKERTWVVVAPDGRFDTNELEEGSLNLLAPPVEPPAAKMNPPPSLAWMMADDPLRPLPLEIFMQEYYEPSLLPRILAGEKLPPLPALETRDRVQPKVAITAIKPEGGPTNQPAERVSITVTVSGSHARDLRLFRDRQLVAQQPGELGPGPRTVTFRSITLPRRANQTWTELSAYAFNADRVKSATARRPYLLPRDAAPRTPRAFIVTVGVNAFEDPALDLRYAVNDARRLGGTLASKLRAARDRNGQPLFGGVEHVSLLADAVQESGRRRILIDSARKAQIGAVLRALGGQPPTPGVLSGVENAAAISRANPEDLVIIAVSTHGLVDERGRFYLLPSDAGKGLLTGPNIRPSRAVSTDDLSEWLRGLDARNLVMIVDACHSAATVRDKEFKPGPMGSRGLGQLAYDKRMRVLAASQVDQFSFEANETQLGLLSYALVHEGLGSNRADYHPKDRQLLLSEWLGYAVERVPELYREWRRGADPTRRKGVLLGPGPGGTEPVQQPVLFDFAGDRDVVLSSDR